MVAGYLPNNAYSMCDILYSKYMEDITVFDLQNVIDECEKNYPILKQVKTLFKQLYSYALCYIIFQIIIQNTLI